MHDSILAMTTTYDSLAKLSSCSGGCNCDIVDCRCNHAKCKCKSFFFIPAEGSWVLRCRCKHRHTDHDPQTHACCKTGCQCAMFHSPWVCNCNHPWSHHKQVCPHLLSHLMLSSIMVCQLILQGRRQCCSWLPCTAVDCKGLCQQHITSETLLINCIMDARHLTAVSRTA